MKPESAFYVRNWETERPTRFLMIIKFNFVRDYLQIIFENMIKIKLINIKYIFYIA